MKNIGILIETNLKKVKKYSHISDYVNPILFTECERVYINGRKSVNTIDYHKPNFAFDKDGTLKKADSNMLSKLYYLIEDISQFANTELDGKERIKFINVTIKGFSENKNADYKDIFKILPSYGFSDVFYSKYINSTLNVYNENSGDIYGKKRFVKPAGAPEEVSSLVEVLNDVIYAGKGNGILHGGDGGNDFNTIVLGKGITKENIEVRRLNQSDVILEIRMFRNNSKIS